MYTVNMVNVEVCSVFLFLCVKYVTTIEIHRTRNATKTSVSMLQYFRYSIDAGDTQGPSCQILSTADAIYVVQVL